MFDPWGNIDWLLPKFGEQKWRLITCASFEPRSIACAEWVSKLPAQMRDTHFVLRIIDPPSAHTNRIEELAENNQLVIDRYLGKNCHIRSSLLDDEGWNSVAAEATKGETSIILDITAMPKRLFLFLVKRFMSMKAIRNLVVCYALPECYREGALSGDALPPSALPGFARISSASGGGTTIVSVGYMAFNLAELLQQSRGRTLKFIFPFPPGSPSVRRSWRLLEQLVPQIPIQTDIRRVHSQDMFALLRLLKIVAVESDGPIDMIPLGPKPHALAMALATRHMEDRSEIIYSQPRFYHPDYSSGIRRQVNGQPDIKAYCLRKDFRDYV